MKEGSFYAAKNSKYEKAPLTEQRIRLEPSRILGTSTHCVSRERQIMAIEYIYLEDATEQPVLLRNFKGLQYISDCGYLVILNAHGKLLAEFPVNNRTCYVLTRRNQSSLQLLKVTPPRKSVFDMLFWLFGFGSKQRCDDHKHFIRVCEEFQEQHSHLDVVTDCFNYGGMVCEFAFTRSDSSTGSQPVAFYCELPNDPTGLAILGKELDYRLVKKLHDRMANFKYPLQYVIHLFEWITMSYPLETREFFQNELHYLEKDVYYIDPRER